MASRPAAHDSHLALAKRALRADSLRPRRQMQEALR